MSRGKLGLVFLCLLGGSPQLLANHDNPTPIHMPVMVYSRDMSYLLQRDSCAKVSYELIMMKVKEAIQEGRRAPDELVFESFQAIRPGQMYAVKIEGLAQLFVTTQIRGSKCEALKLQSLGGFL